MKRFGVICLGSFFLFSLFSCTQHGESEESPIPLPIEYVFDPFITPRNSSSCIATPNGSSFEYAIINSWEECLEHIPMEVIQTSSRYKSIDYAKKSLLSLTYVCVYNPYNIEFSIDRYVDGRIDVRQRIFIEDSEDIKISYIMSNIIVDKISSTDKVGLYYSHEYLK